MRVCRLRFCGCGCVFIGGRAGGDIWKDGRREKERWGIGKVAGLVLTLEMVFFSWV